MELCRGGPLTSISINSEHPEANKVSEGQALNWFRQLLLAIEYLHENDVLHRDIKPENILFADTDRVVCKIVDFGVSEMFCAPNDDRSTKAAGSPAFMSPELLSSKASGVHGRPADIWSLGECRTRAFIPHSPSPDIWHRHYAVLFGHWKLTFPLAELPGAERSYLEPTVSITRSCILVRL